ncbi:MAG: NmrA family NAD(P)-binding protein [Chitinophagaceae bacterium]
MKIIVTGSLGHISRPLTKELVQKGHAVTVISSNPDRQEEIEALGATAAIGMMEDVAFLAATFTGADIVYCMVPPALYTEPDRVKFYRSIGSNYVQAIQQAGVKRVIHLSSYGADLDKGTGLILGAHFVEVMLNELPGVAVTHMRPTYFYYNLFSFIGSIKAAGVMAANYGGDDKIVMVSPIDIAAAIAEEIELPATGHKIRYVASDSLTGHEIASIIGAAIGKPDLKWVVITDEQMRHAMESNGVPAKLAGDFIDMFASVRNGDLARDYHLHPPAVMGHVKLTDFVSEFAAAFNAK